MSDAVSIDISHTQPQGFDQLLEAVTFGTQGLRYRRLQMSDALKRLNQPVFVQAHDHSRPQVPLVGAYVLDQRQLLINGQEHTCYYRGALAVDETVQRRGLGHRLTTEALAYTDQQGALSYGCIDTGNHRSRRVLQARGASEGARLSMYMTYHQWPRQRCVIDVATQQDSTQIGELTGIAWQDCSVCDVTPSKSAMYVLRDHEGVAIAACADSVAYSIVSMSKTATRLSRYLVKPFAPARRRFNPECFRYVEFRSVVIRPGAESLWPRFVNTMLATRQCYFAVVFVDPLSPFFMQLQRAHPFTRWMHQSAGDIHVVARAPAGTMALTATDSSQQRAVNDLINAFGGQRPVRLWPVV